MKTVNDIGKRIDVIICLLNLAINRNDKKLTLEELCRIANISNKEKEDILVYNKTEFVDVFVDKIVDAFGVNKEWLEKGNGDFPFKSDLGRKFNPNDAIDILRWEYLSDINEFIVVLGHINGLLHLMVVRHSGDYCYKIYPQLYPFFYSKSENDIKKILQLYRFLKFAQKIEKLSKKLFWIDEEKLKQYFYGNIAPIGIINEKEDDQVLESILNLSNHLAKLNLTSVDIETLLKVFDIISKNLDFYQKIYDENDWDSIIRKNPQLVKDEEKKFAQYVKEVNKTDDGLTGIESDENNDSLDAEVEPYDANSILINSKSISAFQVEHWVSEKMLDLSPEFQRNLVWDLGRKSALIESMMLNIPIPAFYLDEKENGTKTVIDGMQRLSTIHSFFSGEFKLQGLQYLQMFNGYYFSELNTKYKSRLEETQLTMNILDSRCPEDAKFDVFCRVNTGGMPLNAQEVRNALSTPETRGLLKNMSLDSAFMKATLSRVSDVRMGAQELCLRCICILEHFDWNKMELVGFKGLKKTLDNMILRINAENEISKKRRYEIFHRIMNQCSIVLGKKSFSRQESPFKINKSLFTIWAVCMYNLNISDSVLLEKGDFIRKIYNEMLEKDIQFQEAISKSTTQRSSIEFTIGRVRKLIEDII